MKTLRSLTFVTTLFVIGSFVVADNPSESGKTSPGAAEPAAPAAKKKSEVHEKAAAELENARKRLLEQSSISANLTETISIQSRSVRGTGRYVQGSLNKKSDGWHLRSELKIKVGGTEGQQLEVCDGDILWTRMEVRSVARPQPASSSATKDVPADLKPEAKNEPLIGLTRRNVTQIMEAARSKRPDIPQDALLADLGLGGMPALLASFQQALQFDKLTTETLNGRPVIVLEGTWSDSQLAKWKVQGDISKITFAPFVPERVQLVLDQESGFPHRIVFYKKLRDRNANTPLVTLEYSDLRINQPLDKSDFVFIPPEQPPAMDLTVRYLEQLSPVPPAGAPGSPTAPTGTASGK